MLIKSIVFQIFDSILSFGLVMTTLQCWRRNTGKGKWSRTNCAIKVQCASNPPEVFLGKGVLKICRKCTGEHPCRSVISVNLSCNFIEITLRLGCFPVNLLHIFRTTFDKNTSGGLFLTMLLSQESALQVAITNKTLQEQSSGSVLWKRFS